MPVRKEANAMLASCLPEVGIVDLATEDIDPISRRSPDNLPCQVQNADLWFAETPAELELAKALCDVCPARRACLSGALERREPWGVWGGEIFDHGAIVARKRPRGRPRKADREIAA
jgi:WhiB family redox-sensing transcriptional regulator